VNRAVFLDRDGVVDPLMYWDRMGRREAPHRVEDFAVFPYVAKALRLIKDLGYLVVVVSNQPDVALGQLDMETQLRIEDVFTRFCAENGGLADRHCYCHHHPEGVVPELSVSCACRKPGTLFLEQARRDFDLDPARCWFIGDQPTDMLCGRRFGCRTIKIRDVHYTGAPESHAEADRYCDTLWDAALLLQSLEQGAQTAQT